ncbi:hypothetical protein TSUD_281900 [Trifolium subterraneum]|uniref:COBRA-like protein n=1 Tax=Trifolium subterraneum TaxID=3900 RepID=A0A2Z6PCZ9_TRISU|nr:hypothetical protein TSUD_281900 [Trifolium subterraneum]
MVTMYNFQQYRHIQESGWTIGWTWVKEEVIWYLLGSHAIEQGDCSKFHSGIPHSCKKKPTVVDKLSRIPYNLKVANYCKAGVLSSLAQDPSNVVSMFEITVGSTGTTCKSIQLPKNFTLKTPGPGYTCGPAKIVRTTPYVTSDKRIVSQTFSYGYHVQLPAISPYSRVRMDDRVDMGEGEMVDKLSRIPYNLKVANCCKVGVLSSLAQDPSNAVSMFEITVGSTGTTCKSIQLPKNFTLKTPGPGYTCGPAKIVRTTPYVTSDKRIVSQAFSKF